MHTTLDEAQAALATAMSDVMGDNPDASEDDVAHDMVVAVAFECTDEVALELCRTELGSVPFDLERRLGRQDWIV